MSPERFRNLMKSVKIIHRVSGVVLADGPLGWGIMPFEGNFYIAVSGTHPEIKVEEY